MRRYILLACICTLPFQIVFCQEEDPVQIRFNHLNSLKGQVSDLNFKKIVFADFPKFIIGDDNQFGRAINYVSLLVDKPKATLNLYQKTGGYGFFNLLLTGGYENDLFSVVKNKAAASSFSSTFSYSFIPRRSYKYYRSDKHYLWGKMLADFDNIYTKQVDENIERLENKIKAMNEFINQEFYEGNKLISSKKDELLKYLADFKKQKDELEEQIAIKNKKTAFYDSLEMSAKWSTRKWFWITPAVTYSGVGYKFYDKNAADGKLLSDKNAYTRSATLSFNYLYKSMHSNVKNKVLNNLMLTIAFSYGRQNNFNTLKSSEFKAVEKTDSAANNTSYTRTESYTVYTDTPTAFKEYDAFNRYFEGVKLFGENGTIGLRNRRTWEMPEEKSNLDKQVNWEFGILFNTTVIWLFMMYCFG